MFLKKPKYARLTSIPPLDDKWIKCEFCKELVFKEEIEKNFKVCQKCDFHFPLSTEDRIKLICDEGSFQEIYKNITSTDPLEFEDLKKYKERLSENKQKTNLQEAITTGICRIYEKPVLIFIIDFGFMGGSMGAVVGEKFCRVLESAEKEGLGIVGFFSSGGARMQEGVVSLMQMAKTAAAIKKFKKTKLPYIVVMCHPTTGGVAASLAALGDILIGEPKALIGFAGPRVIEETIKRKLPEGFQRSEYLLSHGLLDMVIERKRQKQIIHRLLEFLV